MRYLLSFFALLCLALPASAQTPPLLNDVMTHLSTHQQVRADFTQSRENPDLAQPQVSKGDLLFVIGHGMVWHTREPFDDTLVLTSGGARRVNAKGELERVRDGNRGISQVSGMLQGLLAGKSDEALRQFNVSAEGTVDAWSLRFTPRQARVAKVLAGITLKGDAFLEGIEVDLASGERTVITFSHTRDAGTLTPQESKVLDLP